MSRYEAETGSGFCVTFYEIGTRWPGLVACRECAAVVALDEERSNLADHSYLHEQLDKLASRLAALEACECCGMPNAACECFGSRS